MPQLTDADIRDLALGTMKELGPNRFSQIAQRLQRYETMGRILRKHRVGFSGGNGIQRNLMVKTTGNVKHVGLYEPDQIAIGDVLAQFNIPWRHTTGHYGWERHEILMNTGKAVIAPLIKVRRTDMQISYAEVLESATWGTPTGPNDPVPYSIPFYVVKNTSGSPGFKGGDPAGFTNGVGGVKAADYPTFQNYAGGYADVNKPDLIKKMRRAYRQVHFESPVNIPDYRRGRGDQYRIYVNEETLSNMEDVGEAQNDNMGRDLAPMDDTIAFRRNPIVWIPILDADTSDPVYFINWDTFQIVFLKGDYMRESEPQVSKDNHNLWVVFVDLTWNILCVDRRANAVLSK